VKDESAGQGEYQRPGSPHFFARFLSHVFLLRQASPPVEATYQLVAKFLYMVRERTGEQLDAWLKAVEANHLDAFESFVTGVQQDKDAALAGLTLPWSKVRGASPATTMTDRTSFLSSWPLIFGGTSPLTLASGPAAIYRYDRPIDV
jgi:hypothetical protein